MATATDIANRALTLIGEARVVSMDDASKQAKACKSQFDITRQSELRANRWGFAMRRAQLAASATAPAFQFARAFPFPTACLRVDFVGDYYVGPSLTDYRTSDESAFAIEGRSILTDLPAPLDVRYLVDVTDASQFDAMFVDAMAAKLAADIAIDLTQSKAMFEKSMAAYGLAIARAKQVNAIERPPEPLPDDSWVLARL